MVNLYSDTQTRPTPEMREAIARADVGDEQRRDDPTTVALEERVAALLGHEAAVFLPSGTMCNEIAIRLHIRPGGDEILLGRDTHPLRFEGGAPSALSGAVMTIVEGEASMFSAAALDAAIREHAPGDRYAPRPRLVCVEQPTNMGGGRLWPLEQVQAVLDVARAHGLRAHLDGARLMNAAVASGVDAASWARGFDTAWLDFTKGLGAPVGACLAGSAELIAEAWRWKQMLGGAMRLAEGLAELPGVVLDPQTVETNIVIFSVPDAPAFCAALEREGVGMLPVGPDRVRAVTHLDVDDDGIERALRAARGTLDATGGVRVA